MKRRLLPLALLGLFFVSVGLPAQETGGAHDPDAAVEGHASLEGWKWLNFAILAAGLGYLIAKKAPAFFQARSSEIQQNIEAATGLKIEADFRASEVDRKMATLAHELTHIRQAAQDEMEAERGRIREQTASILAKIQEHTSEEISGIRRTASLQLQRFTAEQALALSESRLRAYLDPQAHDRLLGSFVASLNQGAR